MANTHIVCIFQDISESWLQERKRNHTLLSLIESCATPQAKAEIEFLYEMQSGFRANEYNWQGVQWASRGQPEVRSHGIGGTLGELMARNKWNSVARRSHATTYSLSDMKYLASGGATYTEKIT